MADGEALSQAQFTAMTEGTQEDWMAIVKAAGPFSRELPDRSIGWSIRCRPPREPSRTTRTRNM